MREPQIDAANVSLLAAVQTWDDMNSTLEQFYQNVDNTVMLAAGKMCTVGDNGKGFLARPLTGHPGITVTPASGHDVQQQPHSFSDKSSRTFLFSRLLLLMLMKVQYLASRALVRHFILIDAISL